MYPSAIYRSHYSRTSLKVREAKQIFSVNCSGNESYWREDWSCAAACSKAPMVR